MSAEEVRISSINTADEGHLIEAELQWGSNNRRVYFRSNDVILTDNTEAFLSFALLPCMKRGGALVADGRVSQRLLDAMDTILDIYSTWESSIHRVKTPLHRVEIKNVTPVRRNSSREHRVGAFFSGGLDSFYTFLKHRDEITDLVFVHGFDIRLDNHSLRRRTSEVIRKIGSSFGKRIVEVETNLRWSVTEPIGIKWDFAHGPALASIGHLLFPLLSRIYIPATHILPA